MKRPELLAPAGSMDALIAAVNNGADAVYLGSTRFGARAYAGNFDEQQLRQAVHYCHQHEVKVYVTVNTLIFENELDDAKALIDFLYHTDVDALSYRISAWFPGSAGLIRILSCMLRRRCTSITGRVCAGSDSWG